MPFRRSRKSQKENESSQMSQGNRNDITGYPPMCRSIRMLTPDEKERMLSPSVQIKILSRYVWRRTSGCTAHLNVFSVDTNTLICQFIQLSWKLTFLITLLLFVLILFFDIQFLKFNRQFNLNYFFNNKKQKGFSRMWNSRMWYQKIACSYFYMHIQLKLNDCM